LKAWLMRVVRIHAHLCQVVRLYGNPARAGGQSLLGETYQARAARGDRTLLQDCLTTAIDELVGVRGEVETAIEDVAPIAAQPGSSEKVKEMARRAERGESLFVDGDGVRHATGPA